MRIKEVKINSTKRTVIEGTRKSLRKRDIYTFDYPIRVMNNHAGSTLTWPTGTTASSETQGQLVGAGERLNGRGKKSGEEKSRTKVGAPGILLLTDQFRNHLKSLPVIGHKNIFCVQSESSSFRVTFVTSYSKLFSANFLLACSPFIHLLMQESFPRSKSAIETRTMKPTKKLQM